MTQSIRRRFASRSLVDVLLDDAELVTAVRELEPQLLGALVRHVGLEDSGELLSLATPDQLRGLADDDLWRSDEAGREEVLDADRFAVWVEVLLDAGPRVAADALAALDEDLLAHALAQHMIVLDLDRLAPIMSAGYRGDRFDDDDLAEKLLETTLSHELDELLLLSVRYRGWDAIVDAIHELDRRDHGLVRRILDRICDASMERVADDGLYDVLTEAERLAEDARGARDDRRERRGFVAPADARAFLALAETRPEDAGNDPVSRSYFRHYEPVPLTREGVSAARLTSLLRDRGVAPTPRMLAETSEQQSPARAALAALRQSDPVLHGQRLSELVYLANVLSAARSMDGDPIDQVDAVSEVLTFVDAGIDEAPDDAVRRQSLVRLFAIGWHRAREARRVD